MSIRHLAAPLAGLLAAGAVLLALGGPVQGETAGVPAARDGAATSGRAVFARMGCGGCHRLAAGGGDGLQIGPDLDTALAGYDAASLRAKIVDPYPTGAGENFIAMPQDFGRRMSTTELDALVAFLLSATRR